MPSLTRLLASLPSVLVVLSLVACSGGTEAGRTYDATKTISFKTPEGWDVDVEAMPDGASKSVVSLTKGGIHIMVASDATRTMSTTPDKRPGVTVVETGTLKVVGVDATTWWIESGGATGSDGEGAPAPADNHPAAGAGAAPRISYIVLVKTDKREVAIEGNGPKGSEDDIRTAVHAIAGSLRIE